jgi:hypothetical protein
MQILPFTLINVAVYTSNDSLAHKLKAHAHSEGSVAEIF